MNWKQSYIQHKEPVITVLFVFIISLVAFGTFHSTILSSDDWTFIAAKYAFGTLEPFEITGRRPLTLAFYYLLANLFGLHVEYYYATNFIVHFLTAILVYAILTKAFPKYTWFAGLAAVVQLVYPVDFSRNWLIMGYIRFWWLITLGAIWLFIGYLEHGKLWKLILAIIGIAVPLGAYEGQMGIILLTGFLVILLFPNTPFRRRLSIVGSIFFVSISFSIWRLFIQPQFLSINDAYVESMQFSPVVIAERYIQGLDIFTRGWILTIQHLFQSQWITYKLLVICLLILYILVLSAIFWISSKNLTHDFSRLSQKLPKVKTFLTLIPLGFSFWFAGYIPVIFLYSPSLQGNASRINTFAIVGASIMMVAAVAILATILARSSLQIPYLSAAMIIPFIIASVFIQVQVNKENNIAWETQKNIWNGVFDVIPDIKDGSKVVVIIPGYNRSKPLASLPFTASWEVDDGAKVLFNNPNIGGYYYYKDIQSTESLFNNNGFRPIPTDKFFPYKKLIFIVYDPQTRAVTLVENLEKTLLLPFSVKNYNPYENFVPAEPSTKEFRWLVQ